MDGQHKVNSRVFLEFGLSQCFVWTLSPYKSFAYILWFPILCVYGISVYVNVFLFMSICLSVRVNVSLCLHAFLYVWICFYVYMCFPHFFLGTFFVFLFVCFVLLYPFTCWFSNERDKERAWILVGGKREGSGGG